MERQSLRKLGVFRAAGGVAAVRWVVFAESDRLGVTDDIGLSELTREGHTSRLIWMAPDTAYRYDSALVTDGQHPDWSALAPWDNTGLSDPV
jgi:hypothetical protein